MRAEEQFSLTLDFMERRLLKGNQEAGMRLNGMRHQIELAKQEAEEVRELQDVSDEAVVGAKEAYTKLVRMRSAVDEMSGRYEELRHMGTAMIQEQARLRVKADRAKRRERNGAMEERGDLGDEEELALEAQPSETNAHILAEESNREAAETAEDRLDDACTRLMIAMPDPSSIQSPQDLLESALQIRMRTQDLEETIESRHARREELRDELATVQESRHQQVTLHDSSNEALSKVESQVQPRIDAAKESKGQAARRHAASRGLLVDAMEGLARLMLLCSIWSRESTLVAEEIPDACDSVERHLVRCLEQARQRQQALEQQRRLVRAARVLQSSARRRRRRRREAEERVQREAEEAAAQAAAEAARREAEEQARLREEARLRARAEAEEKARREEEEARAAAAMRALEEERARLRAEEEARREAEEAARREAEAKAAQAARAQLAEQARIAEMARLAEEARLAADSRARLVEELRLKEVERLAEQERLADLARFDLESRVQTALERYNLSYMGAPSTEAVGEGASAAGEEEVRSRKARQQAAQLWRP